MYEDEYSSKEKEMEIFGTCSEDAQRTPLCTYLNTYGQKESRPPQNHLAPYCGEREDNGGLEVSGICESPGEGLGQVEEE